MLLVHATTVDLAGAGVLIRGPAGSGKSDLALRLIDAGGRLVADDQTAIERRGERLIARSPPPIAGRLEVRGLGILRVACVAEATINLAVDLVPPDRVERLPEPNYVEILGISVRCLALAPFEASAAAKLRLAVVSSGIDIIPPA
ncbi:MAG: HPr kinase/phosphatase C-terminal domain-containing protein [Alphaproteobacteria bacterium]|nr:HPr kinase/phosphatase C-terminal domain-containing protein [Alphaproteobacteria bacterium]